MKFIKRILFIILAICLQQAAFAQEATGATGKSFMYSNGKIYVVMAVVIVIVAGLILYLFSLDKKITRLEKGADE